MQQNPQRTTDALLGKMWKTKSARFNAHNRLKAKQSWSTTATSLLSFYLVIAALIPLVYEANLPPGGPKFLSVVSLIISIFLIIVTLLESAKNYGTEADRMHKCALEISELYNEFQALPIDRANDDRVSFTTRYSDILKSHELNHKDVDFLRFELMFADDLKLAGWSRGTKRLHYAILLVVEYGLYFALAAGPLIVGYIYRSELGL